MGGAPGQPLALAPNRECWKVETWEDTALDPTALAHAQFRKGSVLEVCTYNSAGAIDGNCLVLVKQTYLPDANGLFLEASFAGASSPYQSVAMQRLLGSSSPNGSQGVIHLCSSAGPSVCQATAANRYVLCSQCARLRSCGKIKESWAEDISKLRDDMSVSSSSERSSSASRGHRRGRKDPLKKKKKKKKKKMDDRKRDRSQKKGKKRR